MKRTSAILAFIDLLFNLLLGISMMFIISFLMINPPETLGTIDPPVRLLITLEWDPALTEDMDLWVRGYDQTWVGFSKMDGKYFNLERDDRGVSNDTIIVNGEEEIIARNYEVISFTTLPAGEYFINVHYYTPAGDAVDSTITVTQIDPFAIKFVDSITLTPDKELTVASFEVNENGDIGDMRTDIQMPFRRNIVFNGNSQGRSR